MSTTSNLEQRLRELLRERSITRGEFVLASGGRSTFYIDARRTTMAAEGPAVIVEDVITTGRSALDAIGAVETAGGRVLGVLAVVDREEGGRAALEHAGYNVAALVTATELGLR